MKKYAAVFWVSIFCFFAPIEAHSTDSGTWSYKTNVDAMTDSVTHIAFAENNEGHLVTIMGKESGDGDLWVVFELSENSNAVMGDTMPMFRVDRNDPYDYEKMARFMDAMRAAMGGEARDGVDPEDFARYEIQGRRFAGERVNTLAEELMAGNRLRVRAHLEGGGRVDTQFSLKGSRAAIQKVIQNSKAN